MNVCGMECVRLCLYYVPVMWHLKHVLNRFLWGLSAFKSNNLVALETRSNCVLKATSFFVSSDIKMLHGPRDTP